MYCVGEGWTPLHMAVVCTVIVSPSSSDSVLCVFNCIAVVFEGKR